MTFTLDRVIESFVRAENFIYANAAVLKELFTWTDRAAVASWLGHAAGACAPGGARDSATSSLHTTYAGSIFISISSSGTLQVALKNFLKFGSGPILEAIHRLLKSLTQLSNGNLRRTMNLVSLAACHMATGIRVFDNVAWTEAEKRIFSKPVYYAFDTDTGPLIGLGPGQPLRVLPVNPLKLPLPAPQARLSLQGCKLRISSAYDPPRYDPRRPAERDSDAVNDRVPCAASSKI
ncbi:hypothetical protein B0H11DRAFT_1918235 [Mycena galericulata]|nr:hypothetical protein B0H11DRAFT_1918235 [Mycena galericulata]